MARSEGQTPRESWESAPSDPEPEDLGYDIADWEVIRARKDDKGHLMFLPEDEDQLRKEAFIVADNCSVCDVNERL